MSQQVFNIDIQHIFNSSSIGFQYWNSTWFQQSINDFSNWNDPMMFQQNVAGQFSTPVNNFLNNVSTKPQCAFNAICWHWPMTFQQLFNKFFCKGSADWLGVPLFFWPLTSGLGIRTAQPVRTSSEEEMDTPTRSWRLAAYWIAASSPPPQATSLRNPYFTGYTYSYHFQFLECHARAKKLLVCSLCYTCAFNKQRFIMYNVMTETKNTGMWTSFDNNWDNGGSLFKNYSISDSIRFWHYPIRIRFGLLDPLKGIEVNSSRCKNKISPYL